MTNIQEKIRKSSKTMATIIKTIIIVLIVGLSIPVLTLIWLAVNPNTDIPSINGIQFYSIAGIAIKSTGEAIAEMCTIILIGVFLLVIFRTAYCLFKEISNNIAPFTNTITKHIKRIGTLLLVYSFVLPIARIGFYRSFAPSVDFHSTLDVSFVVLALTFYFISTVFEYGVELQRESDELL